MIRHVLIEIILYKIWNPRKKKYDDKYKDDTSQHQHGNESVINTNKYKEAFIKRLMSMNFKQHVIQYVMLPCGEKNDRIGKIK